MCETLTFEDGWMGGKFYLDYKEFKDIDKHPNGTLYIEGEPHKAVYQKKYGVDDDHGHTYEWSKTHIGIIDGTVKPRFLSIAKISPKKEVKFCRSLLLSDMI